MTSSPGSGIELDYALMHRAADQVDAVRQTLVQATAELQTTVGGTGNPWGADAQGSAFAQVYTQTLQHVVEVMSTHQDQLDYAAQSLRMSAQDHHDNDTAVGDVFTAMGSQL